MRGVSMAQKKLRHGNQPLVQADLLCRSLSVISGGVAQRIERRITNPWDAGSIPAPATNLFSWLPGAQTPDSRNRQTREGQADYTC